MQGNHTRFFSSVIDHFSDQFDSVYGVLITPGHMGGMGICPKVLDEYDIDDMVYLFKRHQEAVKRVNDDIEKAKQG